MKGGENDTSCSCHPGLLCDCLTWFSSGLLLSTLHEAFVMLQCLENVLLRLLCRDVVVQGNPRVYKALRSQLGEVLAELKRIEAGKGLDEDMMDTIRMISAIMDGLKEEAHDG